MNTNKGFSVIGILLALSMLAGMTLIMLEISQTHRQLSAKNSFETSMNQLRENIIGSIASQNSWDKTLSANTSTSCIRRYPPNCPSAWESSINIYTQSGKVLVNSLTPNAGYTRNGQPCGDFRIEGNSACPIRVTAKWEVLCSDADSCKYPEEVITVNFEYKPSPSEKKLPINISKFNIISFSRQSMSENSSPLVNCARKNKTFIGFNQTVTDGDGNITSADEDGCVPLTAFRGATGPHGLSGAPGPMGPVGPPGGNGSPSGCVPNAGQKCLLSSYSWEDTACTFYQSVWCHHPVTQANVGFTYIDHGIVSSPTCGPGEGDRHAVTCFKEEYGLIDCTGNCTSP